MKLIRNLRSGKESLNARWYTAYLILVVIFLYLRTFLLPLTPLAPSGDEVHYFLHGVRMLHGQMPYRDFFTFVPPGTDLVYLQVFRLFGIHAWVVQAILIVLGFCLTCAILWVSVGILDGAAALLPGLLFLVFDFTGALDATHHWWCALFVLIAVGTLERGRDRAMLALAGGLCGIATLFTQTQGGLSLLAMALYLVWTYPSIRPQLSRGKELIALIFPFVLVVGAFASYYSWQVGFGTLTYWTLGFPLRYFSTLEAHTPGAYFLSIPKIATAADAAAAAPYLFIHLLVPSMYVLCLIRLLRKKQSMDQQSGQRVLLITLVGLAMFLSVLSAATPLRLCVVAPPALSLCVWYFNRDTKLDRWARRALWVGALLLLFYLPINRQRHSRLYLDLPTGRVAFLDPRFYEQVRWYAMRTRPGDSFFDNHVVAFLLSLESPCSLDYVTNGAFTRPEQVAEVVRALNARRTQFVYFYPELNHPPHEGDNLGPLREYITKNYHLAKSDDKGKIWERN